MSLFPKNLSKEEFERCKNNPLYWYNNYFLKENDKKVTQEEYDIIKKNIEFERNKLPIQLTEAEKLAQYPLTIKDTI